MTSFLGSGPTFPMALNESGAVELATGAQSIRDSIELILRTAPGERVMRPDFGCRIHDFVFAVNDASTAGAVSTAVDEALTLWEPRIDVLAVTTTTDPRDRHLLAVEIDYRVRSSNSRHNLVFPFYLE